LNVVNLLLKNGAAIRSRNFNKEFPISGAINYNHTDIAKVLNTYVQNVKTTKNEWYHEKMDRTIAKKVLIEYADKYYEEQLHNQNRPDKSSQVLDVRD
jgi:ankyrin repeat protein